MSIEPKGASEERHELRVVWLACITAGFSGDELKAVLAKHGATGRQSWQQVPEANLRAATRELTAMLNKGTGEPRSEALKQRTRREAVGRTTLESIAAKAYGDRKPPRPQLVQGSTPQESPLSEAKIADIWNRWNHPDVRDVYTGGGDD